MADDQERELEVTIGLMADCDHPTSRGVCPRCIVDVVLEAGWVSPDRLAIQQANTREFIREIYADETEAAEAEVATLRRQVEAVRGLLEPHRSVDAISGRVSEVHPVHIRAKDLRAALEGGKS